MKTKLNAVWHRAHRPPRVDSPRVEAGMPKNATLKERIVWHTGHAQHCQCRDSKSYLRKLKIGRA